MLGRISDRKCIATAAVATPGDSVASPGSLVEFRKDKDRSGFALIQEADGKRNWKAVDVR